MRTSRFLLIQCGDTQELDFCFGMSVILRIYIFKTHSLTIMKWVIYKLHLNKC